MHRTWPLFFGVATLTLGCGSPSRHLDLPEKAWSGGDATIQSSSSHPSYMVSFPPILFAPQTNARFDLERLPDAPLVVGFIVEDCVTELDPAMAQAIEDARARLSVSIECGDHVAWEADGRLHADTDAQSDWILTTFQAACFYDSQSPDFTPSSVETYVVKVRVSFEATRAPLLRSRLQLRLVMYFGGSHDKRAGF